MAVDSVRTKYQLEHKFSGQNADVVQRGKNSYKKDLNVPQGDKSFSNITIIPDIKYQNIHILDKLEPSLSLGYLRLS